MESFFSKLSTANLTSLSNISAAALRNILSIFSPVFAETDQNSAFNFWATLTAISSAFLHASWAWKKMIGQLIIAKSDYDWLRRCKILYSFKKIIKSPDIIIFLFSDLSLRKHVKVK